MANEFYPSNRLQKITWRQSTDKDGISKLHFTLHTINKVNSGNFTRYETKPLAKAIMTADQIAGYILKKNSILKNTQTNTGDKTRERLINLFNEIDTLLNMAPCEDDCSDEENVMYSNMANLKESLFDVINN